MDDVKFARYNRVFNGYAGDAEYLTRDCFVRHTQRLAELRGLTPDSPAVVALDEELSQTWDQLAAMADGDHDGRVTRAEWHAAAEAITASMREAEAAGVSWPFEDWIGLLFRVIDADGDGRITKGEYADWLTALGLDVDTDVDSAFAGMDTDGDGILSMDEFSKTYHLYWSDFDPTIPAHRWIGP